MNSYVRVTLGPCCAAVVGLVALGLGMNPVMAKVTFVAIWMMIWWLDNYVRMGITGLLPIVLLPILAVNQGNKISSVYFSDAMILCIGSLLMANAIESCNLHIFAAKIINYYSSSRGMSFILFLFVMITGFLSMWISNTATAALMLPIANALVAELKERSIGKKVNTEESIERIGCALDLAIAFASSLGGMATLIGTGSNIVLMGVMKSVFVNDDQEVTFLGWLVMAGPLSFVNLWFLWLLLSCCFLWRITWLQSFVMGSSTLDSAASPTPAEALRETDLISSSNGVASNPLHFRFRKNPMYYRADHHSNHAAVICEDDIDDGDIEEFVFSEVSLDTESKSAIERNEKEQTTQNSSNNGFSESTGITPKIDLPLTYKSKVVIGTFAAMAILWMTRDPPGKWGWSRLLDVDDFVTDGTVSIAACLFLMILPSDPPNLSQIFQELAACCQSIVPHRFYRSIQHYRLWSYVSEHDNYVPDRSEAPIDSSLRRTDDSQNNSVPLNDSDRNLNQAEIEMTFTDGSISIKAERNYEETLASHHSHSGKKQLSYSAILPWTAMQTLNWDVIFLLGGGFALSKGFESSGLSLRISQWMIAYGPKSLQGFIVVSSLLSCLVTNVMSNVAAANVILPSLVCLGPHYNQSPLSILMPVTFSISLAFLFPMGTPPNAIVMSNQRVDSMQLLKVGMLMTVVSLSTVILFCIFLLPFVGHFHHLSSSVRETCNI